jgi:hypothetical protein
VEFPIVGRIETMSERNSACEFLQARLTDAPPDCSRIALDQELSGAFSSEFDRHLTCGLFDCSGRLGDAVITPSADAALSSQTNSARKKGINSVQ